MISKPRNKYYHLRHQNLKQRLCMSILQIEVLNPKAELLLQNLEALELISIKSKQSSSLSEIINKIRSKNDTELTLEEISQEVEIVRAARYEKQ